MAPVRASLATLLSRLALRGVRLSTRLGLAFTGILVLAAIAQTAVYFRTRDETLEEANATYTSLAEAIEVAAMQIGPDGWKDERVLADYIEKLGKKGLRDIRVSEGGKPFPEGPPSTVQGKKRKGPPEAFHDVVISGVIGQGTTNRMLQLPLVVGGRYLGVIQIYYSLENIRTQLSDNFRRRLFALLGVFALGLLVILVLAHNATRPIEAIADAAEKVAAGRLDTTVVVDRDDEIGRLSVSFNRMTAALRERQELELRLAAAERRAEIGHLASGLAHEIKNPLNALSLGLDVLRRRHRPVEEAPAAEYTARIERLRGEISRLATLINNFLAFGRPLTMTLTTVELGPLVEATLAEMGETAERVRVVLSSRVGERVPAVRADGSLLKSALWNLVQNAVQAQEETGGRVEVTVQHDGPGGSAGLVAVTVEDDGPGIEPAHLSRLFEPYFSTKEAGVGLGLAMVRRIVEEHGGRIAAGNREGGRGACFRFTVPVAAAAAG